MKSYMKALEVSTRKSYHALQKGSIESYMKPYKGLHEDRPVSRPIGKYKKNLKIYVDINSHPIRNFCPMHSQTSHFHCDIF